ncbi:MAG: periplasmic heavy metal sensor [Desulfatitalea sp.]
MFARILILVLAIASGLIAVAAQADGSFRGKWWATPQIAQELQLTTDEIQRLDDAYDAAHLRMIDLKSNADIERTKLRTLLEQHDLDETAALEQNRRKQEARAQLSEERFKFLFEVRKIIGHDRFTKLLDIRDAQRRQRHTERTGEP